MAQVAAVYGVRKKGWDALSGVAAVIQRNLPKDAWDRLPDTHRRFRHLFRNVRQSAVSYVLHPLVMDPDSFESLKDGGPIATDVRETMDVMVAAAGFPDGGTQEFVDMVLADIADHF
jgi:hypothetical protein